jgi:hypothetical protein
MKKFLVFLLWIFLGLLIPSILGIILPKFYNDNIGIFGLIIFILSVYIGYRNFHKVKSSELAKKLVDVYSYTENSVASISNAPIAITSLNAPMQCMLKGVCSQCLQKRENENYSSIIESLTS